MNKKYNTGICFGAWDMFHIGHLNLLRNAKAQCKRLIVCVSTDEYIEENKEHVPVIKFRDRLRIVNSIQFVDDVDFQDKQFTKKCAIKQYKPEVIFVGDDWKGKEWDGKKLGVKVEYLKYTKRISTTKIKDKIKNEK